MNLQKYLFTLWTCLFFWHLDYHLSNFQHRETLIKAIKALQAGTLYCMQAWIFLSADRSSVQLERTGTSRNTWGFLILLFILWWKYNSGKHRIVTFCERVLDVSGAPESWSLQWFHRSPTVVRESQNLPLCGPLGNKDHIQTPPEFGGEHQKPDRGEG